MTRDHLNPSPAGDLSCCPRVLIPFDRREAVTLVEAAEISGKSIETVRRWASLQDLGRRVAEGQWLISRPALVMWLEGDRVALKAYHAGDRESARVRAYFERVGL